MNLSYKYILFISFIFSLNLYGQDNFIIPDSLKNKSLGELHSMYYNTESNLVNDSIIANTYLIKAVLKNDTIGIATAFSFLTSTTNDSKLKEEYLNTAIDLTTNNPSYSFPTLLYSLKAGIYDDRKDFKTALDYYILSYDSALQQKNIAMANVIIHNIGVTKHNLGMYKDALIYARESWENKKRESPSESYLNSLFLISSAYTNNSKLDSASTFNNLGIIKSIELQNNTHSSRFSLLEGVNQFYKSEYKICIDSLKNSLPQLITDSDSENVAIAYYFLGNSYLNLDNNEKSILYLKKMDSIFVNTNIIVPYCRSGYKKIINYYKSKNDKENQLIYTSRLLRLDSILDINYQYFTSNIYEKFEKPRLIAEKQLLIDSLKKDNYFFGSYLIILLTITILIGVGFMLNIQKRKKDFKKFTDIISKLDKEIIEYKDENKTKTKNKKIELLDIDEKIIKNILYNLQKFEDELGFLNKKMTLQVLSKKVGTNTKYLSKVINKQKEKSFSNYINDLRVEYVISRLYSDKQFRKYSIEAIADDAGFKSSRSFFGVFQKKTGISPSYFIGKL